MMSGAMSSTRSGIPPEHATHLEQFLGAPLIHAPRSEGGWHGLFRVRVPVVAPKAAASTLAVRETGPHARVKGAVIAGADQTINDALRRNASAGQLFRS